MEEMLKEVRAKVRRTIRDEGVARFGEGMRNEDVGGGKEVTLSARTGEERGEIVQLNERM